MKKKAAKKIDPVITEEIRKAEQRQKIKEDTERLDKMDVELAKNALNTFLESTEWNRYGCRIVIQGQFIDSQVNAGILVIKNK